MLNCGGVSRSHEAAEGISALQDDLEPAILLANVNILVAEWIPQVWCVCRRTPRPCRRRGREDAHKREHVIP